ncbi:MAG: c-type cytochrome [Gemmatimonadota bacterium]|nr:c-type cytochrome [Gemmatimonadota bacterium]
MKRVACLSLVSALACANESPGPSPAETLALDTLRTAEAAYDPAAFDSISWENPAAANERGAVVFRFSCEKCHGPRGYGDGGFVSRGDTVRPPSFRESDWRFVEDHEGLRRHIFVGTADGMPHWGLEGLKPRDVDAVAHYLREGLRTTS